jgi:hypothetical protein
MRAPSVSKLSYILFYRDGITRLEKGFFPNISNKDKFGSFKLTTRS